MRGLEFDKASSSMSARRVLVTGANGFVGRTLCAQALERGMVVHGVTRTSCALPSGVDGCAVGDLDGYTDWREALVGCDAVVHLAARVHVMQETTGDPLAEFRRVNVQGTLNLARQAVTAGVFGGVGRSD